MFIIKRYTASTTPLFLFGFHRQDNDRSFSILNDESGRVRVGKANHGLSLTVDFSQEIQVIWRNKKG